MNAFMENFIIESEMQSKGKLISYLEIKRVIRVKDFISVHL